MFLKKSIPIIVIVTMMMVVTIIIKVSNSLKQLDRSFFFQILYDMIVML